MPRNNATNRRGFLRGAAIATGSLVLGGCDALPQVPWFRRMLWSGEDLTRSTQRALLSPDDLAPEYSEADLSPEFRANGSTNPDSPEYQALARNGFADWRLAVGGLVERPGSYSLADLRALPARTQITRHDCVEGWSCIGKWKGVPLGALLQQAGLKPEARFIVFSCADALEQTLDASGQYYESIGLEDAFHPQTILAYEMNDEVLPIPHGAPLRVRIERQLGYKMAKYIMRIDAVESFARIARGQGGFWEDRGYEWYAGI
jgi:DMSO/TMAO reductase YedYZ molybdopterin-dependent catalytic subunit